MSHGSSVWWRQLLRLLVAYRIPVYLIGVVAVGIPLLLRRGGVEVPVSVRTAVVVVALAVMSTTYVGELVVGRDHVDERTGRSAEQYSMRTKVAVVVAVVGLAACAYFAVNGNLGVAIVFLAGSYLFARIAFRDTETSDGREREVESSRGN